MSRLMVDRLNFFFLNIRHILCLQQDKQVIAGDYIFIFVLRVCAAHLRNLRNAHSPFLAAQEQYLADVSKKPI